MNNTVGGFSADGKALFASCLAFFLVLSSQVFGCGLSWDVPQDHFPGVNGKGFVSYFEKVGTVDMGDDLKLPLIINFNSSNEKISPYLGKSFTLFLLESNIVQTGDNSFMATFPDGSLNLFIRNSPEDTILQGSAGWKGVINGDTITAWAPCGWKFEFYKGHILSITTAKSRKLEFVYLGNVVQAIREGGAAKFTVEQGNPGEAKALEFNAKRIEIALDQKPRVQNIAGQNVVGGIDRSLKSLDPSEGASRSFEFAVDQKVQPTLKIADQAGLLRLFTWDAGTKRAISDNDWTYNITPHDGTTAAINRTNSNKQSEFWFRDTSNGMETIQGVDGVKIIKTWFLSGPLSGKIRKIERIANGKAEVVLGNVYDEQGRLIRRITRDENGSKSISETFYRDDGSWSETLTPAWSIVSKFLDEKSVDSVKASQVKNGTAWKYSFFDKNAKILALLDSAGKVVHFKFGDGFCNNYLNGKLFRADNYYPDGKLKEQRFYKADGQSISQIQTVTYDAAKRTATTTITSVNSMHNSSPNTIISQYDASGRLIEFISSVSGTSKFP